MVILKLVLEQIKALHIHKNNVEFQIVIEIFCECPESLKFDKNVPDRKILIKKNHLLIKKNKKHVV